jgi:asparagine synthase (glutamine-hydrolysing)
MCGITGYIDLWRRGRVDREILSRMTEKLFHRGPDSHGYFIEDNVALGFRRLSIIDLEGGSQPMFNEDRSLVSLCNGEIFNYLELRKLLLEKKHQFKTNCDVEILVHLYEEAGIEMLNQLNGQFAFAIYDRKAETMFLARDHCGINPLYYTVADGFFLFASEIKALLEHPAVAREVDLTGLDQVLTLPGLVSPRTMFKGIQSLKSGHYLKVDQGGPREAEYWDLDYPTEKDARYEGSEDEYAGQLKECLNRSVKYRLQSDVPVGFYLSGGLDSSLLASLIRDVSGTAGRHSLSIGFEDQEISEVGYQRKMAEFVESIHHEIHFDQRQINERLRAMIYHAECPVKETYNTCSMALSEGARKAGIRVILTGEGADEIFAGYVGYRFDRFRANGARKYDLETALEDNLREKLWGDKNLFYEKNYYQLRQVKKALYAESLAATIDEFECPGFELVNKDRLKGRHFVHQRSYLDFKLRLSDHLISDHGDRMALANSVEARYPFLDIDVINCAVGMPPDLKLNQYTEKYILRKVSEGLVPPEIITREKFGFHAPGSPRLLRQQIEWIDDLLSYNRIRRQGYFNPDAVERLKLQYMQDGFRLNLPFEDDLLTIVLTFGIFLEVFDLPCRN